MKQIFTLTLCSLAATLMMAQTPRKAYDNGHKINFIEQIAAKGDTQHQLEAFYTNDLYQFNYFHYDANGRLTDVVDSVSGQYMVIDSLFYNAQGQMTRLSGWQRLNGILKNVYYIDYTYDAAGNIATRTNYNNFGGEWNLGGVYNYTYNADHQITLSTLTMASTIYQKVEYTYANGNLQQELWYSYDGFGLYPSEKIVYYYSGNRLSYTADSSSDDGVYWDFYGRRTYAYNEQGNCTEYHYFDYTGGEVERSLYTIASDLPLSDVTMPWTPEQVRPNTYNNLNAYTREAYYTVDVDHHLQYVCDYIYRYSNYVGIASPAEASALVLYPNPASSQVTLQGLSEAPVEARVYDVTGRLMFRSEVSAQSNILNVSMLRPGLYAVVLPQATLKLSIQ